jgi:hypothetical protein
VFENRLFRRIFGPKRDKNRRMEEVASPNIIRQIKSRRMRWGDMWHAWERRGKFTGLWWESRKERDYLEDQGTNGRMGSEWICVQWIQLAQDGDRWWALVSTVMNFRVLGPRS